jgi:hypothetical protein
MEKICKNCRWGIIVKGHNSDYLQCRYNPENIVVDMDYFCSKLEEKEQLSTSNVVVKIEKEEEKPKFNEPWKPEEGESCFRLTTAIEDNLLRNIISDIKFKTYDQALKRAKEIKVYNLLKNFSLANGGDKIDFQGSVCKPAYYIAYDYYKKELKISSISNTTHSRFSAVYFISQEVAQEALRKYRKELEELGK